MLGVQNDEAIFAGALYEPLDTLYSWRLGAHSQVPLMLMSYLGCLKSLLYAPLFLLFGNGIYTVREPVLVAGAASIWLFFLLLRRISDARTANIGCWLLAMDSLYLLTSCYDWGPVALQHLLIVGGAWATLRFYQMQSGAASGGGGDGGSALGKRREAGGAARWLALGCLLFGLALWDKALALWMLSGLGVAVAVCYPRQIWGSLSARNILLSAAAFLLGALPLISYNLSQPLATIRENTVFDTRYLLPRVSYLAETAKGVELLGYLNAEDDATPAPHRPRGWLQTASAEISSRCGNPSSSLLLVAVVAGLLLAPFGGWGAVRAVLFFLVAMGVAWFQMAINPHTGNSVHHTILLWPWPLAVIAIGFGAAAKRLGRWGTVAAAAAVMVVGASSLLVTNEYYSKIVRNGGTPMWSAAVFPLAESVKGSGASTVYCTDWGIIESVGLLDRWRPTLRNGVIREENSPDLAPTISDPSHLFLAHTPEAEAFTGVNEHIVAWATKLGYAKRTVRVIGDGFGRNVFEVYRFVKVGGVSNQNQ